MGAVKIKQQYFSPLKEKAGFGEMTMTMSIDNKKVVVYEEPDWNWRYVAVLIFNMNSLQLESEVELDWIDQSIPNEVKFYDEYDDYGEPFYQVGEDLPIVTVWWAG